MQLIDHPLKRLDTGDVHEWHAVQAEDQCLWISMRVQQRALEVLCRSKEHRTCDLEDHHPWRQRRQTLLAQLGLERLRIQVLGLHHL